MAQPVSGQGAQTSRNAMLAIGAIVLILIAVFVIYRTYMSTQPQIAARANLPFGSGPKGEFLKQQRAKPGGGGSGAAAQPGSPQGQGDTPGGQ